MHEYTLCIRASLPRVSVKVFFSNERCTLLLWTIIADLIQFAIFRPEELGYLNFFSLVILGRGTVLVLKLFSFFVFWGGAVLRFPHLVIFRAEQ